MASNWMPGAKVILSPSDGGSMLGGTRKVVWHTTENDPTKTTATNVAKYLQRSGNGVHIVWNPHSGEIVQMIPGNRAGRGLANLPGGVQTNRAGIVVIQIEVVGRASQPFTSSRCLNLAKIQAWLLALGIPQIWSGTTNRSTTNWAKGGHFGHADVPENSHWDPGAVNKTKLAIATKDSGAKSTTVKSVPAKPLTYTIADVKRLQSAVRANNDGIWGSGTERNVQTVRSASRSGTFDIQLAQRIAGVKMDGDWGPASKAAVAVRVAAVQGVLRVTADGGWGAITDKAFTAMRKQFYK